MESSLVGRTLGRYRVLECIGAGAMGEVYRAHDQRLNRDVAIKVIHSEAVVDDEARRRLRREADTLSKLNHPNIATIYDFDSEDGVDFVVMELIGGLTLADRIGAGPIDEVELLHIGAQIVSGLEEAHEHGVVHRDLKPGNVMITPRGQVKLLDFGLAQRLTPLHLSTEATMSVSTAIAGTFPYMAPEQLRNQPVGPRTDVWALGAVLYEAATGRRPFPGSELAAIIDGILNQAPDAPTRINPSLSAGFEQIVLRALSKAPGSRFQSAAAVGAALQALQAGTPKSGGGSASTGGRRRQVRPWAIAVATAVLVVIAVAVALRVPWRTRPGPSPTISVLVAGVENRTGDSTFDQMLPELLATTLEQSRTIDVFPQSNLGYVLRRMQREPTTRIDEAIGREICQREGLSAVVLQSISRLGNSFVLVVRAVLPDGRLMASTQQSMTDLSVLPSRIDAIGSTLRASFGESSASIAHSSVPLAEVTSPSLEAVRFFTLGRERIYAGDPRGALVFMQKAVDTDPEFAMAHAGLGVAYTNVSDMVRAEQHLREAAARVSRLPEVEGEKILGDYSMVRRNYDAACPHFQVLTALRPRDPSAFLSLGYCSALKLDFATAVSATTKAYEMQPSARTRVNMAIVAFLSGDAKKAFDYADAVWKEVPGLMQAGLVAGKAELAQRHFDAARRIYQRMVAAGGDSEIEGHAGLADLARSTGRPIDARAELEAERAAADRRGNRFAAITAASALAELATLDGSVAQFERAMAAITTVPSDVLLQYRVGRAWARAGRLNEANRTLKTLETATSEPSRQYNALKALLRAEIALGSSKAVDAVQEAEAAVGFEPSTTALDTLARAYVAANRGADAIGPLEQMVSRPNERCESYDAPSCYRVIEGEYWLGRLKGDAGDEVNARQHLERFTAAWSGSSHPMLDDAKTRLAAIR